MSLRVSKVGSKERLLYWIIRVTVVSGSKKIEP